MSSTNDQQLRSVLKGLADLVNTHLNDPAIESPSTTCDIKEFTSPRATTYRHLNLRFDTDTYAQMAWVKDNVPKLSSFQKIIDHALAAALAELTRGR